MENYQADIASSYSEIITVNGIRQLILSTGLDAFHIRLAVVFNDLFNELEVYFNEKMKPNQKPLFNIHISSYRYLEEFFDELKNHQAEDALAL